MKKLIPLILFLFFTVSVFSQDTYLDTLKSELELVENNKTYLYDLLKSEKQDYRLAVINNKLGLTYQYESNLDSAFYCHKKALLHSFKGSQNNQEIGVSYNKIGIVYYYKGELDSAIIFFEKAIPYYQDKSLKANSYNNLAIMYKYNSNPDLAIENYLSGLNIYQELLDTNKQVAVLGNIGALYNGLEDYNQAKKYLTKGLNIALESGNKDGEMMCKSNLADAHIIKGDYKIAIPMVQEAIAYYESIGKYQFVIVNKNNLANCYDELGEGEKALDIYLEVLELMNSTGIEANKESILVNIGSCYEGLGDNEKGLKYSREALSLAKSNDMILSLDPIYKNLSSLFQKMNNIDSSLYYKDLQIQLKDSLDNVEKEKKMMELEAEHHNKELNSDLKFKQSELDETENQRAIVATRLTYALFIIMITVFGVVIFYNRYKKKKKLSEELSKKNQISTKNISNLKSTIGLKDEEIENLSHRQETGKLPYPKNLEPLTEREAEVLVGVKDGLKDKEIAERLFLSVATIRTHLRKAYVKIDARNRAEAIQFITEFDI